MFDLTHPSPSPGSYGAEPLSVAEIDVHPDSDRIWATIQRLRADLSEDIDDRVEIRDDALRDAHTDGKVTAIAACRLEFEAELRKSGLTDAQRKVVLGLFADAAREAL